MELTPISVIHSPYKERKDAPRQGRLSDNKMILEIFLDFTQGLKDITRASHIFVLYWSDRAKRDIL
ncbi:MAG: hypothetical protein WAV05_18610 [Anaerolineales bacterium]